MRELEPPFGHFAQAARAAAPSVAAAVAPRPRPPTPSAVPISSHPPFRPRHPLHPPPFRLLRLFHSSPMASFHARFMLLVLVLLSAPLSVHAGIIQLQIVHRHGARHALKKNPTDPREETRSGSMYPKGIEQLQKLGDYIRQQYIVNDLIWGVKPAYNEPSYVASYSSNLDRTLISARAFLSALYPNDSHRIPTRVYNEVQYDWRIRGYAICPKLASRFAEFVAEKQFKQRDKEDGKFVAELAKNLAHPPEEQNLQHVFNVYDEYTIVQNDYDSSAKYNAVSKLSQPDMTRLTQIADWYESTKFSFATHNVRVARGLLKEIENHAVNVDSDSDKTPYRIIEYSAHYPTLLTLWASIRANSRNLTWPADRIPQFGAALIIEIHKDDHSRQRYIRLKWYEGGDNPGPAKPVQIGSPGCTDAEKGCRLEVFQRITVEETIGEKKFCTDCDSDMCDRGSRLSESSTSQQSGQVEGDNLCSVGRRITAGAIGACVGLTVGLLAALVFVLLNGRKKRRDLESHARTIGMEQSTFHGDVQA
ncbi:Testicular acid phosphatase-like [Gracilariopsis chorda]|uniref:Testicular acid phosphatase-like n=1 Tax=Gracilariopsis chorda TaxID=448386 RepID=A0A2V3IK56_9FLOR|nr:Testicular acid phosphatase-like [Gracilariopsis chorda]|eukprot:PXF42451.1 Testicular acid phosphatase-like [Gracilariopsis chorda]